MTLLVAPHSLILGALAHPDYGVHRKILQCTWSGTEQTIDFDLPELQRAYIFDAGLILLYSTRPQTLDWPPLRSPRLLLFHSNQTLYTPVLPACVTIPATSNASHLLVVHIKCHSIVPDRPCNYRISSCSLNPTWCLASSFKVSNSGGADHR